MNYNHPELRDHLAAEYVLGTLHGWARRRFERLLAADPTLAAVVREWEARLMPLAQAVTAVEPPARVWALISDRLGLPPAPAAVSKPRVEPRGFWESLAFWRGLGLISSAVAAGLLVYLAVLAPGPKPVEGGEELVAVLADEKERPVMLVSAEPRAQALTVKVLAREPIAGDRSYELWALPAGGAPKSLGLVAASGITRIKLDQAKVGLVNAPAMAISLEPRGGSPTGLPTGPVLFKGAVVKLGSTT
jgi:anti-sigma-K factor RskA